MIKAVIFDVGGVLHTNNSNAVDQDIRRTLKLDDEMYNKSYKNCSSALRKGNINETTFWQEVIQLSGTTEQLPDESLFLRTFKKTFVINQDVLSLVESLKKSGYNVSVLSNTIPSHAEFNRKHGLYNGFDQVVLSTEVGMEKPDAEIYIYTLKALNVKPEEAVFVDDLQENIEAANIIGMHGLLFTDADKLKKDFIELGVKF